MKRLAKALTCYDIYVRAFDGRDSYWQGLACSSRVVSRDLSGEKPLGQAVMWYPGRSLPGSARDQREWSVAATQKARAEEEMPGPGRGQMATASQAMLQSLKD